jgi:hypothetical protein
MVEMFGVVVSNGGNLLLLMDLEDLFCIVWPHLPLSAFLLVVFFWVF